MKQIKNNWQLTSDYQLLLHLSDIQHWKKLPRTIAEVEVKYYGFHICVYDDKIMVVVR